MKITDIGFERFEEDFYANPKTMFIVPDIEKPIKIITDNLKVTYNGDSIEITKHLDSIEVEEVIRDIFGTTDLGILNCSDMSDEEIDSIVDKWNSIPEEYVVPIEDWKKLGYTDEEAEKLSEASKIYQ